ncbi:MAG TPA: aldo/keto reductase [Vicinamibacterales bacterium]|jgi:aryl-alcohol dehydrogenase-like predicted oxidoreductase/predicted kinase
MRLSTEPNRDESRATPVLHAALAAGIEFFDTADAYCCDEAERGHNERLIARALAAWPGDRSRVRVGTKGGLTRPGGRWVADGRARHLREACERSLAALGVERLDLYQLHAPDPRVPLATSIRALEQLKREGLISRIGLCNVTVGQIEEARGIADIESVQVELSAWHDHHFLSGVVDHCLANRIPILAYRPLGGPSRRRRTAADPTLAAIAARHDATAFEIALAWLMDLSELITPLPGAGRIETVHSCARAGRIVLSDADRAELDRRFPYAAACRPSSSKPRPAGRRTRDADVVIVMGMPAAGKSTLAQALVADGYYRLNRDETGGTLRSLLPAFDRAIEAGRTRIVLDNTYPSRRTRAEVIHAASLHGLPIRCVWLSTGIEDAQANAAGRIVARYGRLPSDSELAQLRRSDVALFLPAAQFTYRRELEAPDVSEGFSRVDVVPFVRRQDSDFVNKAVLVSCDTVDDLVRLAPRLREFRDAGYRLLGISWQPDIAAGKQTDEAIKATFARACERLGLALDIEYCPHAAGPPRCWCRKPLPGLGVLFVNRYRLDPAQCFHVGAGPHDIGFARRLGFTFCDASSLASGEPFG